MNCIMNEKSLHVSLKEQVLCLGRILHAILDFIVWSHTWCWLRASHPIHLFLKNVRSASASAASSAVKFQGLEVEGKKKYPDFHPKEMSMSATNLKPLRLHFYFIHCPFLKINEI